MSSSDLYGIHLTMNDGTPASFGDFRGRPVLVVNVASRCGFTPQYAGLEALYGRYSGQGLVVLGMPCNQFMGQEPLDDGEIAEFCSATFGVTFPLLAKGDVRGRNQHPLYQQLTTFRSGVLPGLVKWNFEKFLIDRDGGIVARFAPTVEPEAPEVVAAIEKVLEDPAA